MEEAYLAGAQKSPREGRLIVFVDKSGISQRLTRVRTWVPKGHSPVVQFHFNWNHVVPTRWPSCTTGRAPNSNRRSAVRPSGRRLNCFDVMRLGNSQ